MPIRSSKYTLDTTPQMIVDSKHAGASNVRTHTLWVDPLGGSTVWIGGDDLLGTGENGFPIPPNGTYSIDIDDGDDLWAVVLSGEADVYVVGKRS